MDALGGVLLVIIILIVIVSNILFIKRLRKNQRRFKYIFLFFLFCFFSIIAIGLLCYAFERHILIEYLKIEITNRYTNRIIKSITALTLIIITNYNFAKFYLKRISKTKNEIELIGKE
ncbi:hypothetical protein SAMN05443663_107182 [Flavobacterium defluvii]|uniref:Uncharacterized protein n=1 Tax=Flavobacterium defluvii TaxID=370979 RepID=A0A1M5SQG5_9FLAO|nr:hypothetical protein SAMN05443663_107182 [Flavobacterium defluvii]